MPAWLALVLSGCAVGPDYHATRLIGADTPLAWHATLPHRGSRMLLAHWWEQFRDPALTQLIAHADATSPTLALAVGHIREARAAASSAQAALLPLWKASGSTVRQGSSEGNALLGAADGTAMPPAGFDPSIQRGAATALASAVDVSWELDLFGGKRRSLEGANARLAAAVSDWHDARVTLAAEVAHAYLQQRQCETRVDIGAATLASRQQTLRLTRRKLGAGFVAPADLAQAQATVADASKALEGQRAQCMQGLNRLVTLTGREHAAVTASLTPGSGRIPVPPAAGVPDVPAQLLSQRPDVSSAERAVAGASADIGVAMANRLPSLTLMGSIGINAFRSGGQSFDIKPWSFGPSASLPIFDGGAGTARVETARARYDQALANYRAKVRQAVQEVEDALVRLDAADRRLEAATVADTQYTKVLGAANARYRLGAGNLLQLEDVRRTSLSATQSLASVRLERAQAWVALYKAVGGGWRDDDGDADPLAHSFNVPATAATSRESSGNPS